MIIFINSMLHYKSFLYVTLQLCCLCLGDQLKNALKVEAKKKSKVEKFFCVKHTINAVPLQMTRNEVKSLDEVDNFHHREEVPQTFSKEPTGDISIDNMFDKAKQDAQDLTPHNQDLTKEERDQLGNLIALIGQAGIGKSTLTKSILNKILEKDLFGIKYPFHLQFRDLDYMQDTNLLSFLAQTLPLPWINNPERRDAVLTALSMRNDIILIMDGFDEAIIDASTTSIPTTNLYATARPEVFIKSILRGTIFGNAKKIITSRPRQLLELPEEIRPTYILNILGLKAEEQHQICKDVCDEDADQVFHHIQQQPSIATYCYVPCNCILVMHAIHHMKNLQTKKNCRISMPETITDVFATVLCLFVISPHVRNTRSGILLQKLAHLAWEGFKIRKFTFSETNLQKAHISEAELNLFLVTSFIPNTMTFVGGSTKTFYFSHLLIQEFFAAIYLFYFTSLEDFKELVTGKMFGSIRFSKPKFRLTDGDWEIVTKFLFGICNKETRARLSDTFYELESSESAKVNILCKFALDNLPNQFISENSYFQKSIPVCNWVHEMHDDDFATKIARRLKKKIIINGKVLPSDVASLNYVLCHRQAPIYLDCSRYDTWFVGKSINYLLDAMEKIEPVTVIL